MFRTRSAPPSEAQLQLSAIVSSSDDAIIGLDLSGTVTSWNQSAERMFGYSEAEALGQSIASVAPPDPTSGEDTLVAQIQAGKGIGHYYTVRLRKDGGSIDVSISVSPILAPDGTATGMSMIARDITLIRQLERDARRLAAIVEFSDDAIISKDLNGIIVSWNLGAERLFGYSAEEMVGRSIRLIVPADRQSEEDQVLGSIRRGEVVDHFETVRLRKDGTLVPISLTVSPIRSASGQIVGASKIARDLSRSQQAQRDALRLAAIVDSSDDAIISKDLNGIVTSWNAAAETMFGYSAAEMIGESIRLLIPHDRQQEEDEVLAKIRRGERVDHFETLRRRKDGSLLPVSLSVSPIRGPAGTVVGASKIARDISERAQAEHERQRLLTITREASRMKDEFLATLSHELRTPLNAIVGYTRMLQAGLLSPDKHSHALDVVARNASSLARMVDDVLDVSRIISGKVRLNVQPVELVDIIDDTIATTGPAAEAKGIRIEKIIDPQAGPVSGDPERLRQVLWNLCSNAVKFTPRGGRVEVRLERVNSHVEVTVTDTGIGMSSDFLPYLFERFRQADAGIDRVHGGLGLGLAITRHLVELQGGHISATSEGTGRGSTFRIALPLRSVHPGPSSEAREHPHVSSPDVRSIEVPLLTGIRVLVVDDDADALALVREILETTGASVIAADSGHAALEMLRHSSVDILIADLGMPKMNGFELINHVRNSEDAAVRSIHAAALTAFARSEDRTRALRSGFEMHLSKPIDPGELMAAVATLARRASIHG